MEVEIMGYYMELMESNFSIAPENQAAALKAIKSLAGKETNHGSTGDYFSWVDTKDFLNAQTLEEALSVWRWETEIDAYDNVTISEFTGEKLGDDELLFQAIAPYVDKDSFIQMQGEDGSIWRWVFDGNNVEEIQAKLVFE
jgi:hypothetical protein